MRCDVWCILHDSLVQRLSGQNAHDLAQSEAAPFPSGHRVFALPSAPLYQSAKATDSLAAVQRVVPPPAAPPVAARLAAQQEHALLERVLPQYPL